MQTAIFVIKNGELIPAYPHRMFDTHGPFMLNGRRLDQLSKVELLVDSSTTTSHQSGTSTSKANTGNMLKRAVIGGVVTGGVGAVVGAVTGSRDAQIASTTTQTLNAQLTAELAFIDGGSEFVMLTSIDAYHWLLSMVNQTPMTDTQLASEQADAERVAKRALDDAAFQKKWKEHKHELASPTLNSKIAQWAAYSFGLLFCIIVMLSAIISSFNGFGAFLGGIAAGVVFGGIVYGCVYFLLEKLRGPDSKRMRDIKRDQRLLSSRLQKELEKR